MRAGVAQRPRPGRAPAGGGGRPRHPGPRVGLVERARCGALGQPAGAGAAAAAERQPGGDRLEGAQGRAARAECRRSWEQPGAAAAVRWRRGWLGKAGLGWQGSRDSWQGLLPRPLPPSTCPRRSAETSWPTCRHLRHHLRRRRRVAPPWTWCLRSSRASWGRALATCSAGATAPTTRWARGPPPQCWRPAASRACTTRRCALARASGFVQSGTACHGGSERAWRV